MLSIWRFSDGKRGHDNQSLGLAEALGRLAPPCTIANISVTQGWPQLFNWLRGRFPAGATLPQPDLIIGAGHATHWPMLAARRAHGGRIAVLMRPSLPLRWFDWVIAPEHDGLAPGPGRLATRGALNRIRPAREKDRKLGLMLIGGPSSEFGWDANTLLDQVRQIALHDPQIRWRLTSSRRTPPGFLDGVARLGLANVEALGHEALPPDWLPQNLAAAAQAWVTPDSASMVYEALSSGAAVGCFELPAARPGRVAHGLEKLLQEHTLTGFKDWPASGSLSASPAPLDEAARCAKELLRCLQTR